MPGELAACVERANLDPAVHVIALAGNGTGFCGGYDLVDSAESLGSGDAPPPRPAIPPTRRPSPATTTPAGPGIRSSTSR